MIKTIFKTVLLFFISSNVFAIEDLKPSKSGLFNIGQLSLYLECYGSGSPSIIVNSGFGGAGSSGDWQTVVAAVSSSNQICLYDRANIGKSEQHTKDYDLGVMVEHLHKLLDVANVKPPYLMVGHSFGSYPIKLFNHRYANEVAGVLLVDPTQYGMFYNGIAKWAPEEDIYDKPTLERMHAELSGWNEPTKNPEKINLKTSATLIQKSKNFGNKPFVLLWAKNGIWSGGEAPDDWHPKTWNRMKKRYAKAIEDMHNLSTNKKITFANTRQHNIYTYEPESVIKEIRYLLKQL